MGKNVIISTLPNISQNYLPKVNTSNIFANSLVYDDGNSVLINTTTASAFRLDVNGTARTGALTLTGALSGTSATFSGLVTLATGVTQNKLNWLGYNSAYTLISSDVGYDATYNGLYITHNTNSAGSAQGNAAIPSWYVNLGGSNQFNISRSNAGSFTFTPLFTLSGTGAATFSSSVQTNGDITINSTNAILTAQNLQISGTARKIQTWNNVSSYIDAVTFASTGAATFSGSISAGQSVFSNAGKDALIVSDTRTQAAGVGGSILFRGVYTNGGSPLDFGRIGLEKVNSTNADYGFNMAFYTSPNGGSNPNTTAALILGSNNAATFSSNVTATNDLTINAALTPLVFLNSTSTGKATGIITQESGTSKWAYGSSFGTGDGTWNIYNYTAAKRFFTITTAGNCGIGTDSPSAYGNFAVASTVNIGSLNTISAGFSDAVTGTLRIAHSASGNIINTDNALIFQTGGTSSPSERMRITSGGDVLVGTTTTDVNTQGIQLRNNGIGIFVRSGASCLQLNRLTSDGIIASFRTSDVERGSISISGSTTTYNTSSDYRLKYDYKDYNGLDIISKIKSYDFAWKENDSRMYGVIAHELQEILGYAVVGEKDGVDMQGVDYSKLTPILVKAIQELNQKITLLENK